MWSMDFVSDALFDGRRLRALTVVDAFTREALAIDVDQGIKGEQVVAAMTRIALSRGAPQSIRVDNGPEFISKARSLGLRERRHTRLQPAWQADGQCVREIVQRPSAGRMPEHALVSANGGRPREDRGLAARLQREPSSHIAWLADAARICCCRGQDRRRMKAGNSRSGWMRNRGTLMNAGNSPSTWMRNRETLSRIESKPCETPADH